MPLKSEVRVDVVGAAGDLKLLSFPQNNIVFLGQRDYWSLLWHWIKTSKASLS